MVKVFVCMESFDEHVVYVDLHRVAHVVCKQLVDQPLIGCQGKIICDRPWINVLQLAKLELYCTLNDTECGCALIIKSYVA